MESTLRDTIRETSRKHIESGYQLFGQCLTAVGWVGGTIPELPNHPNLVELSMADVLGGGIVVGSALVGKRPIYVVRYQGFQWFNSPIIANYAGKTKEIWNVECPIFVRSISMEGGIGPVAGSSHHGIFFRMPGIKIASPMTPLEYQEVYNYYMSNTDTVYVSEHRKSYDNKTEFTNKIEDNPDVVLFPFSITRFESEKAREELKNLNIKTSIFHQLWINPLKIDNNQIDNLKKSKYGGIVIDDDYPNGIAKQIAYELMLKSNKPVRVLCIDEKSAGFQPYNDNLPPSKEKIINYIKKEIIK
jgi:pyruvate/2-oxoglutarate/acetoin dehydrogenase E1 component